MTDNMFHALYNKYINSQKNDTIHGTKAFSTWSVEVIPFRMDAIPVNTTGTNIVYMNITLSLTGKVVCIVAPADDIPSFNETEENAWNTAYFYGNRSSIVPFYVTFFPNISQQLFCLGKTVRKEVEETDLYVSDPYYVTCSHSPLSSSVDESWNMEVQSHGIFTTTIAVNSGRIVFSKDPILLLPINGTVRCHVKPIFVGRSHHRRRNFELHMTESGIFPLVIPFKVVKSLESNT